jgi:serine/threonine-protein kinase
MSFGAPGCPDEETLVLYLEGALDGSAEAEVRRHISTCGSCRSVIADAVRGEATPPAGTPRAGDLVLGKYELLEQLGEGGMGRVYRARHVALDRDVAIKFLRSDLVHDPAMIRRFEREARAAAALNHDHAVQILDISWLPSGAPFIVMEYLPGTDLARRLQERGPFRVREATRYVLEACEAVSAAHARGIVHRDLKPHNLFLVTDGSSSGRIKVLDFGLAKIQKGGLESRPTEAKGLQGSPYFMSPEQVRGEATGPQTDIWSLGATLYTLVVGQPPFLAPNLYVLLERIVNARVPRMGERRSDVPVLLDEVVAGCLQKSAAERWATVDAFAGALRAALSEAGPPSTEPARPLHVETLGQAYDTEKDPDALTVKVRKT